MRVALSFIWAVCNMARHAHTGRSCVWVSSVAVVLIGVSGCVSPLTQLTASKQLSNTKQSFVVRFEGADEPELARLQRVVEHAEPVLARWGGLQSPVTIYLLPNHLALTRVVGRNYDWLRAWGTDAWVLFQAPRSWPRPGTDAEVATLLTHELTHCAMFQQVGNFETVTEKDIPLWFREGMATVTAQQGATMPTLEDLARWFEQHPDQDTFADADSLQQTEFDIVYGGAHHAFNFLVKRYGDEAVVFVLQAMRAGDTFDAAFQKTIGLSSTQFVDDFRTYVRMRGFRGWGVPMRRKMDVPIPLAPPR